MFYDESKEMKFCPEMTNKIEKGGMKRGFFGYDYRNLQKDPISCPTNPGRFRWRCGPGSSSYSGRL